MTPTPGDFTGGLSFVGAASLLVLLLRLWVAERNRWDEDRDGWQQERDALIKSYQDTIERQISLHRLELVTLAQDNEDRIAVWRQRNADCETLKREAEERARRAEAQLRRGDGKEPHHE